MQFLFNLLFKVIAVERDLEEMNEMNVNERKDEDIEESDGDEELDDDEFEVDHILNVAAVDGEVKYLVTSFGSFLFSQISSEILIQQHE